MKIELLTDLIAWGVENGATLSDDIRFEYSEFKGIRCVCDKNLIRPALKIPHDIIISAKLVSSEFPDADIDGSGNTWLKFLLSKLRFSRGECKSELGEKFKPYMECLPNIVDCPLVWNPRERELLDSTNLGNSLNLKLHEILEEWHEFVNTNGVLVQAEIAADCLKYENFQNLSLESIFQWLIEPLSDCAKLHWSSAPAFLWSHLMLISRAFPEYIIDQNTNPASVMLLPVIDLLNHDYRSKVEWAFMKDEFCYQQLEMVEGGNELCNNYGCKGNEELLSGYGFVLDDNPFDYVALKIKVPQETITKILKEEHTLKLPTIDDYTSFAFEYKSQATKKALEASSFKDGIVYFINKMNAACLQPLLDIFAYLCWRPGSGKWHDLIPRFQGLQSLRNALEDKLEAITAYSHAKDHCQEASRFEIKPYRSHCAKIYRDGQISVMKYALKELKSIEKSWLTENKDSLLTVKKILKYDNRFFEEELSAYFENICKEQEDIVFENNVELLVIWMLLKNRNKSFIKKYLWVSKQYEDFLGKIKGDPKLSYGQRDPAIESFYSRITSNARTREEISYQEVEKAFEFIERNSFTRIASSNPDTIMVKC